MRYDNKESPENNDEHKLILASGSKYRQQRLKDAGIRFIAVPANIDETALADESAECLAKRLALQKAESVHAHYPKHIIVGSDQVAAVTVGNKQHLLGKPGTFENAKRQLTLCSNNTVVFYTSLCLLNGQQSPYLCVEKVQVKFKTLSEQNIEAYLYKDQPFDCAGSFKMEQAGIFLFESIESRDPNALIGLPMIALAEGLSHFDYDVFRFMDN